MINERDQSDQTRPFYLLPLSPPLLCQPLTAYQLETETKPIVALRVASWLKTSIRLQSFHLADDDDAAAAAAVLMDGILEWPCTAPFYLPLPLSLCLNTQLATWSILATRGALHEALNHFIDANCDSFAHTCEMTTTTTTWTSSTSSTSSASFIV